MRTALIRKLTKKTKVSSRCGVECNAESIFHGISLAFFDGVLGKRNIGRIEAAEQGNVPAPRICHDGSLRRMPHTSTVDNTTQGQCGRHASSRHRIRCHYPRWWPSPRKCSSSLHSLVPAALLVALVGQGCGCAIAARRRQARCGRCMGSSPRVPDTP